MYFKKYFSLSILPIILHTNACFLQGYRVQKPEF